MVFILIFQSLLFAIEECPLNPDLSSEEVFKRLVYAEGISAFEKNESCQKKSQSIFQRIAWGVWSRVEQAPKFGKDLKGVIFSPNQFNPAISKKSKYSLYFRCPEKYEKHEKYWKEAVQAVENVLKNKKQNIFKPPVTHFYYPLSEQATSTPPQWANIQSKNFVKEQSDECLWFFRY